MSVAIAFVGAGQAGTSLLQVFAAGDFLPAAPQLVGVADPDPQAPGLAWARELGVYVTTDYHTLYQIPKLDLIVELTGSDEVLSDLTATRPARVEVMGHQVAQMLLEAFKSREDKACRQFGRAIIDGITDDLRVVNRAFRIVECNEAFLRGVGLSREEVIGQPCCDITHGRLGHKEHPCPLASVFETGRVAEGELQGEGDNEVRITRYRAYPLRDPEGALAHAVIMSRDVTEARRAATLLEREQAFSANLICTANALLVGLDPAGRVIIFNEAAEAATGYRKDEVVGKNWFEIATPRERYPELWRAFQETRQGGLPSSCEYSILTRDGREITVSWSNNYLREDGRVVGTISFGLDITKRKLAEEKLLADRNRAQASERLLSNLIESAQDAIIMVDADHRLTTFNHKAEELFGYTKAETLGREVDFLMPPESHEKYQAGVEAHLEVQQACPLGRTLQIEGLRRDGSRFPVELSLSQTRLGEEYYFTAIIRDVTEKVEKERGLSAIAEEMKVCALERGARAEQLEGTLAQLKQAQSQLLQSEKMAAIGQLAAGVAHEINNPVGFISSNLNTMSGYHRDMERLLASYAALEAAAAGVGQVAPLIEEIKALRKEIELPFIIEDCASTIRESQEGVERIKDIVAALKDFSRLDQAEVTSADINAGLESTLKIVWNELKYKTTVTKDFSPLPMLRCYPRQLNQVFMNILVNAAQAIEGRGEINIATRACDGPDPAIEVRISDTGRGVAPENLRRIFEPFFTTKPVGKGTGLGLHIAYDIIQKHGGRIDVASEVGRGSVFTITLPLSGLERKEAEAQNDQHPAG